MGARSYSFRDDYEIVERLHTHCESCSPGRQPDSAAAGQVRKATHREVRCHGDARVSAAQYVKPALLKESSQRSFVEG